MPGEVEGERRKAAGRIARWFGHELSALLALLRRTVAEAPPGLSHADQDAATRVQDAARACAGRVGGLLALRPEPRLAVETAIDDALARLLTEPHAWHGREFSASELGGQRLPVSAAHLRLLLKTLFDNAFEASSAAPTLSARTLPQGACELWVTSASTLPEEHRPRVCFPFFSQKAGHQGLGLSLAHAAAENQGGRIELACTPGQTSVGVVFPPPGAAVTQANESDVSFACHLAASLAHDVNNALMAALGWAEILGDARDEEERNEALTTLTQAADYLEAMSYLLPHETMTSAAAATLDLGPAIERMRPLLRAVLEHKADRKIALRVESVPHARVPMSEDALRSVLLRLAEDARDAMPTGGTWTISCDVLEQNLLLTLSGDEPSAHSAASGARQGHGAQRAALGLAVARDLVHASGGSLDLDAKANETPQTAPITSARVRLPGAPS